VIEINGLTKKFKNGKGLFNISVHVNKGEVFGYLGPNGAGKSTTIRHLLGFMKPDIGFAKIQGLDCWSDAAKIHKNVGYLPGEIAFPDGMNGIEFLYFQAGLRGLTNNTKMNELIERFQFDSKTPIRKMSKGMKQKVAIVAAFMHDPELLILDEPTSGLDPLMQRLFIDLLLEEKEAGKTILLSSHIFQEIEKVCDRVAIIKDGVIMSQDNIHELQAKRKQIFEVALKNINDVKELTKSGLKIVSSKGNKLQVEIEGEYNSFFKTLAKYDIASVDVHPLDLEEIFMHYYNRKDAI
jgi:ABC-2 type transport system ATP-binding protein